jgi:hypothetical protein
MSATTSAIATRTGDVIGATASAIATTSAIATRTGDGQGMR